MANKEHILIVDDDHKLACLLKDYLQDQGYKVSTVGNGKQLDRFLLSKHIDLLVLDLMLPGEDGLNICQRIRKQFPNTGIIMLTGKGDDIDRIIGLELGADDYLGKPCNPRELLARVRSVLRRTEAIVPGTPGTGSIQIGEQLLDLQSRQLHSKSATTRLTSGEFALLQVFVDNINRPLSRDQLMNLGRGRDHEVFDRSVDVQISRLRKLLEPDPKSPIYLQTVWGMGYVFTPKGKVK